MLCWCLFALQVSVFQERGGGGEETKEADLIHLDAAEDADLAAEQILVQGWLTNIIIIISPDLKSFLDL